MFFNKLLFLFQHVLFPSYFIPQLRTDITPHMVYFNANKCYVQLRVQPDLHNPLFKQHFTTTILVIRSMSLADVHEFVSKQVSSIFATVIEVDDVDKLL